MLINLLILAFFIPFLTILPFNKSYSLIILDHFFNTNIFIKKDLLSIASLGPILAIIIILTHYFIQWLHSSKSAPPAKKKVFKIIHFIPCKFLLKLTISLFISTTIAFFIPSFTNIKIIILCYLLTAFILLLANNKKGHKKITELNLGIFIIVGLSHFLLFIPSLSPFLIILFMGKLLHVKKEDNLILALLYYLPYLTIDVFKSSTTLISMNYLLPCLLSISLSTILSLLLYQYFKKLYFQNHLTKLAFITFILSIFFLYWFR